MTAEAHATEPALTGLPESVRGRIVAIAADAIGSMGRETLPPSLRRVAGFAPARRGRLAGGQILHAVDADPIFRDHLAVRVRASRKDVVTALEADDLGEVDPIEAAAVAYLLRLPDWGDHVRVVAQQDAVGDAERSAEEDVRRHERLQETVRELEQARSRLREQVGVLKGENAELRRRLGESRSQMQAAQAVAEAARTEQARTAARLEHAEAATESEVRRLRARLDQLDHDLRAARRHERESRGEEVVRARLLLDTLLDAAQGLRRELALPPVEGLPADRVVAAIAVEEGPHGALGSSGHRSLSVDDPALLDGLLRLPRAHLIVDGYNVTKQAWPELSLERQRAVLLAGLGPLAARTGVELTVVFDAADAHERPPVVAPRGVRVAFSPVGVIADDVIRDLVAAEPEGRVLLVVTSDRAVVTDTAGAGARVVGARALSGLLARV